MKSFLEVVVKRFGTDRFYRSAVRRQVLGNEDFGNKSRTRSARVARDKAGFHALTCVRSGDMVTGNHDGRSHSRETAACVAPPVP